MGKETFQRNRNLSFSPLAWRNISVTLRTGGSWLGFSHERYMSVGGVSTVCTGRSVKEFSTARS